MEHYKSKRNFLTVGCSLVVALSSFSVILKLKQETQLWAKVWFVGNLLAAILWATIYGELTLFLKMYLFSLLNQSHLF